MSKICNVEIALETHDGGKTTTLQYPNSFSGIHIAQWRSGETHIARIARKRTDGQWVYVARHSDVKIMDPTVINLSLDALDDDDTIEGEEDDDIESLLKDIMEGHIRNQ